MMAQLLLLYRVLVFAAIVGLIHLRHQAFQQRAAETAKSLTEMLPHVTRVFPAATAVLSGDSGAEAELPRIVDGEQQVLGYVVRTSPQANHIVGFSGPTDVLLVVDAEQQTRAVQILSSGDTQEHVRQILQDVVFMESLRGRSLHEYRAGLRVDAVSGATLTSLAMLEAIRFRLRIADAASESGQGAAVQDVGSLVSLRFPDPPALADIRRIFPNAGAVAKAPDAEGLWRVSDAAGDLSGFLLRTSPAADSIVGYQGPTDTFVGLDDERRVTGLVVGKSYDNEPYVGYVRDDAWFLRLLAGRTLPQLAALDLAEERIEGVSGATMTSLAVMEGIREAAKAQHALRPRPSRPPQVITPAERSTWSRLLTARHLSTIGITLLGVVIGITSLRGKPWLRRIFQLLLIVWLGLINGDMVSQASLLGWAQNGIAWPNAAGLVVLSLAALLVPVATGHNVYCSHICPHGAVQQLIRQRLPWRLRLKPGMRRILKLLPWMLVAWVVAIGLLHLPLSAVDIEPFDAWLWSIAGGATIAVAVTGLLASAVVPMAYCRFGCPTGAVLNFLVRPRRALWQTQDTAGLVLLIVAVVLYFV